MTDKPKSLGPLREAACTTARTFAGAGGAIGALLLFQSEAVAAAAALAAGALAALGWEVWRTFHTNNGYAELVRSIAAMLPGGEDG